MFIIIYMTYASEQFLTIQNARLYEKIAQAINTIIEALLVGWGL